MGLLPDGRRKLAAQLFSTANRHYVQPHPTALLMLCSRANIPAAQASKPRAACQAAAPVSLAPTAMLDLTEDSPSPKALPSPSSDVEPASTALPAAAWVFAPVTRARPSDSVLVVQDSLNVPMGGRSNAFMLAPALKNPW